MRELIVSENEEGQRLDHYLGRHLKAAPSSFLYRMLRKKNITLNGKKAAGSEKTAAGDIVRLFLSDETIARFSGRSSGSPDVSELPGDAVDILYQDPDFMIINKAPGILTQKGSAGDVSLTEYVRRILKIKTEGLSAGYAASPANRLDRNTSGIVLFGLSVKGSQYLTEMLRERSCDKHYLAVVAGRFDADETFRVYYTKDTSGNKVRLYDRIPPGEKKAGIMMTGVRTVDSTDDFSLLDIRLITGKPHQIRAHMAYLGHPVAGDPKYGRKEINCRLASEYGIHRQMLHSSQITFPSDLGDGCLLRGKTFSAPMPEDMKSLLLGTGLKDRCE